MLARVFAYRAKIVCRYTGAAGGLLGASLWVGRLVGGYSGARRPQRAQTPLLYVSSQLNYGWGVPEGWEVIAVLEWGGPKPAQLWLGASRGWGHLIDSSSGVGWPQTGSTMYIGALKGCAHPKGRRKVVL